MGYQPALHHLNHIASLISKTPGLIFPCFALEAKGDSGGTDAETQNRHRHNTANILFKFQKTMERAFSKSI
jgi:L-lysine 2,3-aminomutase